MDPSTPLALALGGRELFVLAGLPLLYVLPIWLSVRKYRESAAHWRMLSILATLLLSWVGFILISSIHAGSNAYMAERIKLARSTKKS